MIELTEEQEQRLCPHCARAGKRSLGGVETLRDGTCKRLSGGEPFAYVYAPHSNVWVCPGCLDVQARLPGPDAAASGQASGMRKLSW